MNKILEAIQKGIQMGLEIQDDELDQSTFQKSEVTSGYHVDRADQIRWLRENFIDLGLPSGTLWCKYNLVATCKDTPESWYGNYYAWGETDVKENYGLTNYKFYHKGQMTKYNNKDSKSTLDPEDDVVSVTLGNEFSMPTKEDFIELCSLPHEWVENYNGVNGLNGNVFTGNNGNKLFIPAAGWRTEDHTESFDDYSCVWSSSLLELTNIDYMAYHLHTGLDAVGPRSYDKRYYGQSVRAILKTR